MKLMKKHIKTFLPLILLSFIIYGCATTVEEKKEAATVKEPVKETKVEKSPLKQPVKSIPASTVPPITWQPSFKVQEVELEKTPSGLPKLKVGANVETKGTQTIALGVIVKKLASLKGFNVSWNKDVVQNYPVDVDIKADDDFWLALDNILRQVDYFFEFKKDTLIIGFKQTKTYHLVVPPVTYTFTAAVGGNMIGNDTNYKNLGEVSLSTVPPAETKLREQKTSVGGGVNRTTETSISSGTRDINRFDIWKHVRQNLDTILEIWKQRVSTVQHGSVVEASGKGATAAGGILYGTAGKGDQKTKGQLSGIESFTEEPVSIGAGSYTIDEAIGTIMVIAPQSVQKKVEEYIETVKARLYKQISIEAHILEVQLNTETTRGIDWSQVLKDANRDSPLISGSIGYGDSGNVYQVDYSSGKGVTREGLKLLGNIFLSDTSFELLVNALDEQGNVRTLSEPKINLMNGSPGLLTVGENVRYVKSVQVDVDADTGVRTYTVETDDILSGIAFSVMANILGDDQLILYITPVTSDLTEPIEYRQVGDPGSLSGGVEVGLPRVHLRQISTMAKIKDGDILILGGLIDDLESHESTGVPILGNIPIVKWAFSSESKVKQRRELIVILKPTIINI